MVLHFLPDLVSFISVLQSLGLEHVTLLVKGYPYPQKASISAWIRTQGYDVLPLDDGSSLQAMKEKLEADDLPILVIEDGGHITSELLVDPKLSGRVLGVVEQTTKGVERIATAAKGKSLEFPVLLLPRSQHKIGFEPSHVARGAVRALDNMILGEYLEGLAVCVLGAGGTIGRQVAEIMHDFGAVVTVYDPVKFDHDPTSTNLQYRIASDPLEAVRGQRLIVGASGQQSITADIVRALKGPRDVYLASTSSEQVEIDIAALEREATGKEDVLHGPFYNEDGKPVRIGTRYYLPNAPVVLLADGMPVNFVGFGGMKAPAADLIMSLMLVGAFELARGAFTGEKGLLCEPGKSCIDRAAAEYGVPKKFVEISRGG